MIDQQVQLYLREALNQFAGQFREALNKAGASSRVNERRIAECEQNIKDLDSALGAVSAKRSGGKGGTPNLLYIDDIPGKREPYTMLVEIPISANSAASQKASMIVDQSGAFVATRRFATFLSSYQFATTDPDTNTVGRFVGRSYGRYRPAHSAWDINDGQHNAHADTAFWYLTQLLTFGSPTTTILPSAALGLPSSMSSFRTMEFDGKVRVFCAGSSAERQNIAVPTAFWSSSINSPLDLAALDFFERGDAITFEVQPNHVNNPPAGNVTGTYVFPAVGGLVTPSAGWPFVEGQFDAHEGVATPHGSDKNVNGQVVLPDLLATDSVSRLPDGILVIGYEGYRIRQPIGPVG